MHLRAAANLIPAVLHARMALMPTQRDPSSSSAPSDKGSLDSEDHKAFNVLIGSFISSDIISCASTGLPPFLNINHALVLESLGIRLESLMGCRTSVMVLIFEVSSLYWWKKKAQETQKLSLRDLAERAAQIEKRLRHEIEDINNTLSTGGLSWNSSGILPAPPPTEISKVFALSAMTYLHVIVSGAYPELPEVIKSVSDTIITFKSLKDPRLLQNMVWPFCVSGCMARREEQELFRDLASAAQVTQSTLGTCFEALKIMEECWEARAINSCSIDWVSVMNKRGNYVLLR